MASPLASIFSKVDSAKRSLLDMLTNPVASAQQIVGNVGDQGKQMVNSANDRAGVLNQLTSQVAGQTRDSIKAGGSLLPDTPESQQLTQMMADAYNPVGMVLAHGGKSAVLKPAKEFLTQGVISKGFHVTNDFPTPQRFATKNDEGAGVISLFDFPDELYNKSLRLGGINEPMSAELKSTIGTLAQKDPELRDMLIAEFRNLHADAVEKGLKTSSDDLMSNFSANNVMRRRYGIEGSEKILADMGIPAKTWQYSRDQPELATSIFPEYFNELRPLGQVPTSKANWYDAREGLIDLLDKQGLVLGK
tara:strand:- start:479 stop:1393 length:915 start_codon:yes stop_codon:yes gene_type:complete